jgi:phosphoketolase
LGQGHCVAAIDAVNVLVGNMTSAHAPRYAVSDEGLTRYVQDVYSYRVGQNGRPESPLGSHVRQRGRLTLAAYLVQPLV